MDGLQQAEREDRLRWFSKLGILDTLPERDFDEIVELAAAICGMPVCLISLVEDKRQWFKATYGTELSETPIETSFCARAILQDDLFEVHDATRDERFAGMALVQEEPHVRFYAGMPIRMEDGIKLGTLCLIDTVPRKLTPEQANALTVLTRQVQARLEMRVQRLALEASLRQQKDLAAELKASEAVFRAFMNNSPYLCFIKDADGRMLFFNEAFATQLEVTLDECMGKLDEELWPEAQAREFRKHDLEVLAGGVRVEYQEQVTLSGGNTRYFRSSKFPYEDGTGKRLVAGVAVDMTQEITRTAELERYQAEVEAANIKLQQLSITDSLTGLKNRRAFDERLMVEFALSRRLGRDLSVLLIDIDDFKQVNDLYGHGAGDEVLRELAHVLLATVRVTDLAVRYGGEEFAVLLPDSTAEHTMRCAERFRAALRDCRFAHGPITVSMGVAGVGDGASEDEMVACADRALYAAKHGGKDAVVMYHRLLNEAATVAA